MRRLSLKLRLLICSVLMAAVFSGYTNEIDKDFGFGEIDNKQYVYDYADEYTDSEEKKLQKKCEKLKEELGLDIILVTTNDLGYNDPYASDSTIEYYESQYAESFYLNGGYGDGILYLLDLDYDGIYCFHLILPEIDRNLGCSSLKTIPDIFYQYLNRILRQSSGFNTAAYQSYAFTHE